MLILNESVNYERWGNNEFQYWHPLGLKIECTESIFDVPKNCKLSNQAQKTYDILEELELTKIIMEKIGKN